MARVMVDSRVEMAGKYIGEVLYRNNADLVKDEHKELLREFCEEMGIKFCVLASDYINGARFANAELGRFHGEDDYDKILLKCIDLLIAGSRVISDYDFAIVMKNQPWYENMMKMYLQSEFSVVSFAWKIGKIQ